MDKLFIMVELQIFIMQCSTAFVLYLSIEISFMLLQIQELFQLFLLLLKGNLSGMISLHSVLKNFQLFFFKFGIFQGAFLHAKKMARHCVFHDLRTRSKVGSKCHYTLTSMIN